ncbi:ATP-binding protein [Corallococcus exiguus]|uniref:ATP-binding protein n=1 Tax=Corallococcus exiguus TaxID=83462 RepID=UPI001471ED31|nr:ATP-binding protein [Corallococcus exiguus]NNB93698.1 ATP-binding protein [Corallococcus exiguus]NNC14840.1 ATP-binding protein [Corallococcus exiguus]
MKFTVLRLLTHSELGMFHEYRRSGREGSKQRAINFDADVVGRVFPAAKRSDRIAITCRCLENAKTVAVKEQWLKKQEKNWRLEGNCPTSPYYAFVDPGVLFAMVVDSSSSPASASWVVIPTDHPARTAILNHGESARLSKSAMIALHGEEGDFCWQVLAEYYPQLFKKVRRVRNNPNGSTGLEPDPLGLFKILARAGHSLPSAVADLVDNSLSKGASKIDITFPNPNQGGRWMCIRDNGVGMTPNGLRDAMKIGHQRKYDAADLGKYGYGLKGAAWSQADRLTVVSKAVNSRQTVLTWDKDHLERTRRWEILKDPVDDKYAGAVQLGASGTAVLLTQMRPPVAAPKVKSVEPYAQEIASVRDHLELVFHRFLEGSVRGRPRVIIQLNGIALRPNNPMAHPLTKAFDPLSIELPGHQDSTTGPILTVRAYVLPNEAEFNEYSKGQPPQDLRDQRDRLTLNGRWNDSQGLYFYRLDRLIKWGGWEDLFAKDEHTKLLRVAVDFDRQADDQLQIDISKQLIRLPVALTDSLKDSLKAPRSQAKSRYGRKVGGGGSGSGATTSDPGAGSGTTNTKDPKGAGRNPATSSKSSKKERSLLRLVEGASSPWERKTTFMGEQVEISQRLPELVALAEAIEGDNEAKKALSEFLRVLERANVVRLLDGKPDGK